MNKIKASLAYNMRVYWQMSLWYLWIYPLSMGLTYFALIQTRIISVESGSLIYRIWGSVVFLFAIFIRFKEDFEFLLVLSNTRWQIFISRLITALGFSTLFSVLIVLERVLVDHFNRILGYQNITDPLHRFAPYTVNPAMQFFYFLVLCCCCCAAGMWLGSLFYRFGNKFMSAFWLLFSAFLLIMFPMMMWTLHQKSLLIRTLSAIGQFLSHFHVAAASGTLLLLAVGFSALFWLNIRRLPQQ